MSQNAQAIYIGSSLVVCRGHTRADMFSQHAQWPTPNISKLYKGMMIVEDQSEQVISKSKIDKPFNSNSNGQCVIYSKKNLICVVFTCLFLMNLSSSFLGCSCQVQAEMIHLIRLCVRSLACHDLAIQSQDLRKSRKWRETPKPFGLTCWLQKMYI